jgi:AcrR family transcriptional regulator
MPRPKKTAVEIHAMREKIIDTAVELLLEDGPDAISSRTIAERMGVSHMSLFTYFENQAAILSALRDKMLSKWSWLFEKVKERSLKEDIPSLVEELLGRLVTFARENPNLYRMSWVVPVKGKQPQREIQTRKLIAADPLTYLLELGMAQGDFIARDPFLAANTVLGMVNMPFILYHNERINDPAFRDRMVEEVLTIAMFYLKGK